jgi:hypothetical protein
MTDAMPTAWERAQQAQDKYQEMLMTLPHVVGVAVGYATTSGQATEEPALIVMVDAKVSADDLALDETIPPVLDGVRVDVQEFGAFSAL